MCDRRIRLQGFTKLGTATAGEKAWKDDDGTLMMSAYASIRDSKGTVVAILGVDSPAPEAANFPDWIEKK